MKTRILELLTRNPLQRKGIFDNISGYEKVKWALDMALRSDKPVHILLVGPPGIGKTRFLKAIDNRFPDKSYFALASGASGAGMVDYLFEHQPRFLLLDEVEDMKKSDQAVLMSLMQDQELIETKKVNTRKLESYNCTVIATCNSTKKLRAPLLNRFKVIQLDNYSREEFIKVCVEQLDCDEGFARYIAEVTFDRLNANMREAERISNMCKTMEDVQRYVNLETK